MKRRYKKFCNHYLLNLNAAEAARYAGYNPIYAKQYGSKILARPEVKEYLSEQINASIASEIDPIKKQILNLWQGIAFKPEEDDPKAGYLLLPHKLKASELLAKYAGLLKEGSTLNISDDTEVNIILKVAKRTDESGI